MISTFFGLLTTSRATTASAGEDPGGGGSLLIDEGYEGTGTPSPWFISSGGDPDYAVAPLVGAQSLELEATEFSVYPQGNVLNHTELWVKFRFKPTALPASFSRIAAFADASSVAIVYCTILSSGALEFASATVATMEAGTAYDVWMHFIRGTGASDGTWSIAFTTAGGARPTSGNNFAGSTTANFSANAEELALGDPGSSITAYYDSVQVSATIIE